MNVDVHNNNNPFYCLDVGKKKYRSTKTLLAKWMSVEDNSLLLIFLIQQRFPQKLFMYAFDSH